MSRWEVVISYTFIDRALLGFSFQGGVVVTLVKSSWADDGPGREEGRNCLVQSGVPVQMCRHVTLSVNDTQVGQACA